MTLTPRYPYPLGGGAREGWIIYIYIFIYLILYIHNYTHIFIGTSKTWKIEIPLQ